MVVIRGEKRVADIYLTDFMRLFNHYRLHGTLGQAPGGKVHLAEDDGWAQPFFVAGSPEAEERAMFATGGGGGR